MRVVVDKNIFVSAALKDKTLPALALSLAARHGTLLKSAKTEKQLFEVLRRPRLAPLISSTATKLFTSLLAAAEHVEIDEMVTACRDPTDDKFLDVAINGRADYILSGDADLLILNPFRLIPILNPADFVKLLS